MDDDLDESAEETFTLKLNSADNAQLDATANSTSIVIQDDDPAPIISASVIGGGVDEDVVGGKVTVSVAIDRPSTQIITTTYTTVNGTAVAPSDYVSKTQTLTWNPSESAPITVTINIVDDEIFENDETFIFRLQSKSSSATIGTADTTVAIRNDDPAPVISINNISPASDLITESASVISVTLISDRQSSSAFAVDWTTAENSSVTSNQRAAAGIDYASGSGTLTWPANAAIGATQSFTMTITEDAIYELDESFLLNLTSATADVDASAASKVLVIQDNDALPSITIGNLSVTEADIAVSVPVTMTGGSYQEITVPYTITNGTATAGTGKDYTATATGTLTWPANTINGVQNIPLNILEDLYDDDDETIIFTLGAVSPPGGATLSPSSATLTIIDDDAAPIIAIGNNTNVETNSGTTTISLPVTLTGVGESPITVQYYTNESVITTTATAGTDYTAIPLAPANTITWGANVSGTQTIDLQVNGDVVYEGNEAVQISLTNASIPNVSPASGIVTITNDDTAPVITIGSQTVDEKDTGTFTVSVPVTMTGLSAWATSVDYTTQNDTALAGSDYITTAGTLSWPAGTESTQNIVITINNDMVYEGDEVFNVLLSNNTISSTMPSLLGTVTILENELAPELDILNSTVVEGNSGITTAVVTVTLSAPSEAPVSVRYYTSNGTATTADSDYVAIFNSPAITLTWPANDTTAKTFTVNINGDVKDEGSSEQFNVHLSNATNATIITNQATVVITDDDDPPQLFVGNASINEGNSGTVTVSVPVTMTGGSDQTVSVNYYTADNTAIAPTDYTAIPNNGGSTLTWAANDTSAKNISITINGDTLSEVSETFFINLINPTNATIGNAQGTVTITNDDAQPALVINNASVTEGNSGTSTVTVNVSITGTSAGTVSVDYFTSDNTATLAGSDYITTSNTLTWNSGDTTDKTFTVTVNGDTIDEGVSESFYVNLINPTNATIATGQGQATVTIIDNDTATLAIGSATRLEGNTGTSTVSIPVSISTSSSQTVIVQYYTADNTATTADADYVAIPINASNILTWGPGDTANKSFTVTINGDFVDEGSSENFYVHLITATNATIGTGFNTVTITDDDSAGVTPLPANLTLSETVTATNHSGTFTITLNTQPTSAVRINLGVSNSQCSITTPTNGQANFTTTNWNTGIPITITATDDAITGEGAHICGITMTVANNQSADEYDNLVISNYDVTILDND